MYLKNFEWHVQSTNRVAGQEGKPLDRKLADQFAAAFSGNLKDRFLDLAGRSKPPRSETNALIRDLRQTLARTCVEALEPDLVIMDEFQRFRDLLAPPNLDDPDDPSLLGAATMCPTRCAHASPFCHAVQDVHPRWRTDG